MSKNKDNIQPHDYILIEHELLEMKYRDEGFSQEIAHNKTNKLYNYADGVNNYYNSLGGNLDD